MIDLSKPALALARKGLAIFPLQPKTKIPLPRSQGVKEATSDVSTVERWWLANPACNIGLATGSPSGVWVLDIDGEAGEASLVGLEARHEPLPPTISATTGKGRHLYFRLGEHGDVCADVRNSAGRIGAGIDVRGTGGYVVVPPSVHPSGESYRWMKGCTEFADAPDWVYEKLGLIGEPEAVVFDLDLHRRARDGDNGAYINAAVHAELQAVAYATQGQRNDQLNRSAHALFRLVAERGALVGPIFEGLLFAARHAGLSEPEAVRTIKSAARARGVAA